MVIRGQVGVLGGPSQAPQRLRSRDGQIDVGIESIGLRSGLGRTCGRISGHPALVPSCDTQSSPNRVGDSK